MCEISRDWITDGEEESRVFNECVWIYSLFYSNIYECQYSSFFGVPQFFLEVPSYNYIRMLLFFWTILMYRMSNSKYE